jgi:hypothetical protein
MLKKILIPICCFCFFYSNAQQTPEDAIKFSWFNPGGTARSKAIGNAIGALGGDIHTTFVNPAGLGFYKTNELVISPGFNMLKNNTGFRGTSTTGKDNAFNLGTTGFVFGISSNRNNNSSAFALAVNRTASFNNLIVYKGQNNFSSYSESAATEFAGAKISFDDVYNSNLSLQTKMAVYTYLIDTFRINNNLEVRGRPEFVGLLDQQKTIDTKGGITELAFAYAGNMNDKFYIGGTLGVPIVNYERNTSYSESDATGINNNGFAFSTYDEMYSTKGVGLNLKVGAIFKPVNSLRLGLAIHTPTLYGLDDKTSASMTTDFEKALGPGKPTSYTITSDYYEDVQPNQFKYDLTSPWRFIASGSYVLNEIEDVTKQKGFITADVEYVNYKGNKYTSAEETNNFDEYYKGVNAAVKDYYKSAFNFKVGGELKFTTIMARAGFSYYGSPYNDTELKARRMFASAGLGYRNKGIFVDLTYVHGFNKDVSFPYRLTDKPNTFAEVKEAAGNIAMTIGFKF